ncbi:trypsin-like peptidase domain-containing protein [Streptomyces sp. NPDC046985]|uniref:trypsin-like peptidase domain-containing protein n=1 Tax=Streptomyces sp. NPDC046985 TaxID=3155377 RepID=UPI003401D6F0
MDEGKPTNSGRPRRWLRARPAPTQPEDRAESGDAAGVAGGAPDGGAQSGSSAGAEGGGSAGAGGDYELPRPRPAAPSDPAAPSAGRGAEGGDRDGDGGDFPLARPLPPTAPPVPASEDTASPSRSEDTAPPGRPEDTPPPGREEPVTGAPEAARPATRPLRPLHDPDPYDTPPYGEPGPWAPAPPVPRPTAQDAVPRIPAQPTGDATAAAPVASADAVPEGARSGDPWGRYDPWAAVPPAVPHDLPAVGPFQQSGAGVPTVEQRRRRARRALVGGAVALAVASGVLGGLAGAYVERNGGVSVVRLPQVGREPAGRAPDSVAGIAARALPSVVTLHVSGADEEGTGTGIVLDGLGHILTNNHVVESAASGGGISVTFSGGQTAGARIVGRDTGYDLAVVQVRGVRGLTPMPLGNSDSVRVGDPVVAIGAPFDLANTVTSGIISATERPITAGGEKGDGSDVSYVDALQTDAPINPGNSGGPLLDAGGRVVGVNSAIRSADSGSDLRTGQAGSIGLGFAIPVNQARRVAEELINTGRASHPVIGVSLDLDYTGDGARVGGKAGGGASVTPGGPADKAGVKAGDVITAVDGQRVRSGDELIARTRAHRPGDRLELTVKRAGVERRITLVLGSSSSGR